MSKSKINPYNRIFINIHLRLNYLEDLAQVEYDGFLSLMKEFNFLDEIGNIEYHTSRKLSEEFINELKKLVGRAKSILETLDNKRSNLVEKIIWKERIGNSQFEEELFDFFKDCTEELNLYIKRFGKIISYIEGTNDKNKEPIKSISGFKLIGDEREWINTLFFLLAKNNCIEAGSYSSFLKCFENNIESKGFEKIRWKYTGSNRRNDNSVLLLLFYCLIVDFKLIHSEGDKKKDSKSIRSKTASLFLDKKGNSIHFDSSAFSKVTETASKPEFRKIIDEFSSQISN